MSSRAHSLWRRIVVAVATLALSLLGVAGVAHAADPAPGNINPSTSTSLTIHKYDGAQGKAGDGTQIGDTSELGNPLSGVEFTVTPVTTKSGTAIDLTTPEGWDAISGIKAADVTTANGYVFGTATTVTTGTDGSATSTLPKGLYLVTETGSGSNNIVSPTAPFLVTLPLPQSNGKWLYDVHVYPKNQVNKTTPTKVVADPKAPVLGSEVTWTITAPVPAVNTEDSYSKFVISDTLDPRLSYVSATVTNDGYTTADYTVAESGGTVTVTFTSSGLAKLKAGDEIKVNLVTKVTSLGEDGVIKNTAVVNTNDSEVKTNTPSTNWGPLKILKYAQGDESTTLAGAEFDVCSDAACSTVVQHLTTGSDGVATVSLWVGNNDITSRGYWVKETKAPAGYVLDSQIRSVTVNANGPSTPVELKVANTQQDHPGLPLTGGEGQRNTLIAGVLLLMVAVGLGIGVSRRRSQQH